MAGNFADRCNLDMVGLESLDDVDDIREVQTLIEKHIAYTGSAVAQRIMSTWEEQEHRFVKVIPMITNGCCCRKEQMLRYDQKPMNLHLSDYWQLRGIRKLTRIHD